MFRAVLLLISAVVLSTSAQIFVHQPVVSAVCGQNFLAYFSGERTLSSNFPLPSIIFVVLQQVHGVGHPELVHPAVVMKAQWDSQLPPELQKSARFYNNPKIAAGLAAESWFTDTEHPVFEREADKIDRNQITKIFRNAGLMKKK